MIEFTTISQIAIACTGLVAIFLTQQELEQHRRFACLFGLAGQPFWFYSTFMAEQWGIFALSFFYTYAWYRGLRLYWL